MRRNSHQSCKILDLTDASAVVWSYPVDILETDFSHNIWIPERKIIFLLRTIASKAFSTYFMSNSTEFIFSRLYQPAHRVEFQMISKLINKHHWTKKIRGWYGNDVRLLNNVRNACLCYPLSIYVSTSPSTPYCVPLLQIFFPKLDQSYPAGLK